MDARTELIEIGRRISNRRKDLHMTQEILADKMGVSVQSVSYIETGRKGIRPENLIKLCKALEVSADYILTGIPNVPIYDEINSRISKLTPTQLQCLKNIIDNCISLIDEESTK